MIDRPSAALDDDVGAGDDFGSADQHTGGDAFGTGNDIEHRVQAVTQVDVGVPRRAEQRRGPRRRPLVEGMTGAVVAGVGLGFDDL